MSSKKKVFCGHCGGSIWERSYDLDCCHIDYPNNCIQCSLYYETHRLPRRYSHTKDATDIDVVSGKKDYSRGEKSPYNEWRAKVGNPNQEGDAPEPYIANADRVPESSGLFYQAPCEDERLDLIQAVYETLTPRQQEILRMCGNEGRTIENTAAILGISRGSVQKTLDRIRLKVLSYKHRAFPHI